MIPEDLKAMGMPSSFKKPLRLLQLTQVFFEFQHLYKISQFYAIY